MFIKILFDYRGKKGPTFRVNEPRANRSRANVSFGRTDPIPKFVSPVRHDQQNLGIFCLGLNYTKLCFAIENHLGLTIISYPIS
jgi:hypothetical protein